MRQECPAIGYVFLRLGLCVGGRVLGHAKVFLEARNRLAVAGVLLETSALVVDVGRLSGADEELGEDRDTFVVVAAKARLSSGALLGLLVRREGRRGRKRYENESDRTYPRKATGYVSSRLAHGAVTKAVSSLPTLVAAMPEYL